MANYGEMLDDYDPMKEQVYGLFADYFHNPKMIKIKNEGKYSMYGCKVHCLLSKQCRYILVFTYQEPSPIGSTHELKSLEWISFQTRTLDYDTYKVSEHAYIPKSEGVLKSVINRVDVSDKTSTYHCEDFPIVITLLHTPKKDRYTYQQRGHVIAALETWETIVTFRE